MKNFRLFHSLSGLGLWLLLGLVWAPQAATAQNGQAIAFNDAIISEQTKIGQSILALAGQFQDASGEELWKTYHKLVAQIGESRRTLAALPVYAGGQPFHTAATNLFRFYGEEVTTSYAEMIEIILKPEILEADMERMQQLVALVSEKEATLDASFQAAQRDFASQYGFSITENELQQQIDNLGN